MRSKFEISVPLIRGVDNMFSKRKESVATCREAQNSRKPNTNPLRTFPKRQ